MLPLQKRGHSSFLFFTSSDVQPFLPFPMKKKNVPFSISSSPLPRPGQQLSQYSCLTPSFSQSYTPSQAFLLKGMSHRRVIQTLRYWQGEGLTPNMLAQAPDVSVVLQRGGQSTKDLIII